jgi:hypothetical protein
MRLLGRMALALSLVVLMAAPALAQRGGGGGGPRGGFGGPGGGGPESAILMLLRNKSVQKELNIDDADVGKIPDAVIKALESVLKPEQVKRLKEIALQQQGSRAFSDAKVQTALKISDEQKEKFKAVQDDAQKEMAELFPRRGAGGGGGERPNFEEMRAKFQKLNKETMKKMVAVLDADQKKTWTKMIGEPFEMKFDAPMGGGRARPARNNN